MGLKSRYKVDRFQISKNFSCLKMLPTLNGSHNDNCKIELITDEDDGHEFIKSMRPGDEYYVEITKCRK
jgi:hypothetical protein